MYGRRFSEGLHQAIEAKEGVRVQRESLTWATITFQNYFRMYEKLAGMTGTAMTEQEEFFKIYNLDVIAIPTHRGVVRVDYPDGVYKFGDQAATLSNPIYPNSGAPIKLLSVNNRPPRWQNGKLILDSRVSNTLVWSAFQAVRGRPFATHGIAEFTAGFISNFSAQNTDFRESGVLSASKRPFNRHTFPKNSLKSDRDYWISLRYFLASYLDPSTLSAAGANTTTYIPVSIEP
jgi:hypothetical protein